MSRRTTLVVGWTLAIATIAGFCSLGAWQARRAVEKQAMLDAADRTVTGRVAHPLALAADAARSRTYDWAEGEGRFLDTPAVLLDNQQRGGRNGLHAYRAFQPAGGGAPLLVDLGWLPMPVPRALPAVPRPDGTLALRGLLVPPPSPGLKLGPGVVRDGDAWLATRMERDALAGALVLPDLAPRVLRLDPALTGLGSERDLVLLANTLPPEKHRGYSVQWYGLALTVLITALLLTFRSFRRSRP